MSRIYLAFACFFLVLFRGRLPEGATRYLPEGEAGPKELPAPERPEREAGGAIAAVEGEAADQLAKLREDLERAEAEADKARAEAERARAAAKKPRAEEGDLRLEGALTLLSLLQREGRLVDFLRESLDTYEDSDIGAAVRDIHRGCRKVLEEHVKIEPVMPGDEEAPVTVPRGFDPGEIRLVGEANGEPPFRGVLVHHGWRAVDVKFPTLSEGVDRRVLAPAEVRL